MQHITPTVHVATPNSRNPCHASNQSTKFPQAGATAQVNFMCLNSSLRLQAWLTLSRVLRAAASSRLLSSLSLGAMNTSSSSTRSSACKNTHNNEQLKPPEHSNAQLSSAELSSAAAYSRFSGVACGMANSDRAIMGGFVGCWNSSATGLTHLHDLFLQEQPVSQVALAPLLCCELLAPLVLGQLSLSRMPQASAQWCRQCPCQGHASDSWHWQRLACTAGCQPGRLNATCLMQAAVAHRWQCGLATLTLTQTVLTCT